MTWSLWRPGPAAPDEARLRVPPRDAPAAVRPETTPSPAARTARGTVREINRRSETPQANPHDHVLRAWEARLEPSLADLAAAYEEGRLNNGFTLPLFDGKTAHIRIRRYDSAGAGSGVFRGAVADEPGSLAVLAYVDGAESGTVQIPSRGEVYRVRTGAGDTVRVEQVDVHAMGECGVCAGHAVAQPPEPRPYND